ncbi:MULTISPECIES: phage major tail tube protein [Cupriavidus]|uniref:Bacteriophage P2 major tail sheath protein GPFII n=1 Tax=Cupriavidus taiwanensis (strain DSM 17343 / BCRC 17206 / CCUG 44338 / CIP 107171 / LMG 19424 / R1) TaxID=977880 RepID=B3R3J8_CUPTR|nr:MULTISPECIES: phage major tail tube protein [Cupriavidus]MEC3766869.1 phage major tail tube protein [Cupriavidus sp. SS-3]CAQ68880.1 bacteriophage P2 major tail sheath protein GPFII [Cupriavidus taiwanensis LMG 19424]SOZ15574.1 bacteriophage P2 major tail sheath protein GPFII [Cupriavidus taiwanensis]SOZ27826.1 bacteriophage P2 major tail sheath protein GPFII [Cupriavidus taiwanensis]SOZ46143.1 bacteriophage P2 major tail sheath protein GPFII [Cupriavidus taiwanensis]
MAMPRKLKNFNVFADGVSHVGECEEITLPKLTRKLEEYRAGGMNGPIDLDFGNEKLELETTYGSIMREILKQYGVTRASAAMVRFAGAYQRDDTGDMDAVEVVVRGRHTELDFGTGKVGDSSQFKVKSSLAYYKLTINGEVWVEIDHENFIEVVFGVDRLAEQRRAMGL